MSEREYDVEDAAEAHLLIENRKLRATVATLSANLRAAVGMVQDFYNWFGGASGYKNKPALLARARAVLASVDLAPGGDE